MPVGQHPVVCRFLKGAFERRPLSTSSYGIWEVQQLLRFFEDLQSSFLPVLKGTHFETSYIISVSYNSEKTDCAAA